MVKSPNGYPVQSPYIAIANRQAEIMLRIASEFGFTPASRSQRGWMTASHPDLRLERSLSARRLEVCPPQVSAFTGGFEAGLASRRLKGFQPSRAHLNTLIAAAGPDITARVGDISLVIQDRSEKLTGMPSSGAPRTLPVFPLTKCPRVQARHVTVWKVPSPPSAAQP